MSILWKPNGTLNVATDPSDLPEVKGSALTGDTGSILSEALARCKNLRLDQEGVIKTRFGSSKLNATAIETAIHKIIEQGGIRYTFAGTRIYRSEASIDTGKADDPWSAMLYNAFNDLTQDVFALNGTDRVRIEGTRVREWGIDAPTDAPTVIAGGQTGLTGAYRVKYTYCRKSGSTVICESNPSPASTAVTLNDGSLSITWTASADVQVTHVRVYRTLAGGSTYYHDQDVSITQITDYDATYIGIFAWEVVEDAYISGIGGQFSTQDVVNNRQYLFSWEESIDATVDGDPPGDTYLYAVHYRSLNIDTNTADTIADGSLGSEVSTDHDRPPLGSFCIGPNYNGTCFIAKDNLLYFCLPKQPEYWPATYFIEVSAIQFPIQCVVFFNGAPYCLTKNEIYNVQGTGHDTFFPYGMNAITGAQGPQAACSVHGKGIFHIGSDGVYLFSGSDDKKVTQTTFDPIFRGEDAGGMPGATDMAKAWIIQFGNKLYVGYVSTGHDYPTNVIVLNLDTGRATYYDYPMEIRTVAVDEYNNRLLAGDSEGYIWALETGATDDGDTIAWEAQSKDYMLQTRAHFPRFAKYDVDASGAESATGYVILDGAVHQTHTLTGRNRDVRKRLVATGNGQKAAIRVSGTGPVSIYAVEGE